MRVYIILMHRFLTHEYVYVCVCVLPQIDTSDTDACNKYGALLFEKFSAATGLEVVMCIYIYVQQVRERGRGELGGGERVREGGGESEKERTRESVCERERARGREGEERDDCWDLNYVCVCV